ncbi:MAG: hypothetical protein K1X78_10710 [Verrucomicrobiaceae bacterium]|nr:hypothetical protein [Verrucomicrobiaceae bacterium]
MITGTTTKDRTPNPSGAAHGDAHLADIESGTTGQECPLVLIVEDDPVRSSQLAKMAKDAKWDPLVAETIEKAIGFATAKHQAIRLALIDDMLPAYEDDLGVLRKLENERESLSRKIREVHEETTPAEEDIQRLKEDFAGLNSTWRSLIVHDGGLLFLEEAAKAGWLNHWRYAILSATDRVEGENAMVDCGITQHGVYLGWFQKPDDVEKIGRILGESKLGEPGDSKQL